MDLQLSGRKALVLGASSGLGRGVAEALAAEGVHIVLAARASDRLTEAAMAIASQHGVQTATLPVDLSNSASVEEFVQAIRTQHPDISILVNNTGGPSPSGVEGISVDTWKQQFETMVLSLFRITDAVLPGMKERQWGRILTIASAVVVEPNIRLGVSVTLRSALAGWSKTLATEVAPYGVTVNMLLPGHITTDRTHFLAEAEARKTGKTPEAVQAEKARNIPAGRYGTVEEFGATAAFLSSTAAAYITGSMIRIDGGALKSI